MRFKVSNHRAGLSAEVAAEHLLRLRGYHVLVRRYKTSLGEIDLIVARADALAFVEVKKRGTLTAALEAIDGRKRRRCTAAAEHYLSCADVSAYGVIRFDAVVADNNIIVHLVDIFN